tara:strand:+ start:10099 stop:10215 length:117 start_codon:yes stop_codon:yes gene_type:complete
MWFVPILLLIGIAGLAYVLAVRKERFEKNRVKPYSWQK